VVNDIATDLEARRIINSAAHLLCLHI